MTIETVAKRFRMKRSLVGATATAVLAATLVAAAPAAAEAATYRYGPYIEYKNCVTDRNYSQAHRRPGWNYGACYQMGPGAAGWYYNGTYSR